MHLKEEVKDNSNMFKKIFNYFTYFGLAVGLVSGVLSIYYYLQNKEPNIVYEILTNSNVIDLHENLSKLEIKYDSTNINKENENLSIIVIRVKNTGGENILKSFFDENDPLGLLIEESRIVDNPTIINASTSYLKDNVKISMVSNNKLILNSIIFDKNEYFDLKLLVLHKRDKRPIVNVIGKISGIKEIEIEKTFEKEEKNNRAEQFFNNAFSGDFLTQVMRSIGYFLLVLFIIIEFMKIFTSGPPSMQKMTIDSFLNKINYSAPQKYLGFINCKIEPSQKIDNTISEVKLLYSFFNDEKLFNKNFELIKQKLKDIKNINIEKNPNNFTILVTRSIESLKNNEI